MQKDDFLQLLQDPDVCREIFEVVRRGGKPIAQAETQPPEPKAEPAAKQPEALPKDAYNKSYLDQDRIAALKDRVRNAIAKKNGQMPQGKPEKVAEEPEASPKVSATTEAPKNGASNALNDKLAFLRNHVQQKETGKEGVADAPAQESNAPKEKYTIVLEKKCPVCEFNTKVIKCKSRMVAEKKDLDLCTHYKGFNPYLYTAWVCEHCGFAAEESKFLGYMPNKTREKLKDFLMTADMAIPFKEERTPEEAISFCEMAILYSEMSDNSPNRQAGLHLKIAWICRESGDTEREREAMQKAAELYALSLETERYPVGKMSDNTALYLTGAIYFMLEQFDEATKYLSRIISDQSMRSSAPKIYEKARDIWHDIKEMKKA